MSPEFLTDPDGMSWSSTFSSWGSTFSYGWNSFSNWSSNTLNNFSGWAYNSWQYTTSAINQSWQSFKTFSYNSINSFATSSMQAFSSMGYQTEVWGNAFGMGMNYGLGQCGQGLTDFHNTLWETHTNVYLESLQFKKEGFSICPRYENWEGLDWSGGIQIQPGQIGPNVSAIDQMDSYFKQHDICCYIAANMPNSTYKINYRINCDAKFYKEVFFLPTDPGRWNPPARDIEKAISYRSKVLWWFGDILGHKNEN